MKPVSVVIPIYNETKNIKPLCERLAATLKENYEIILVDDESEGTVDSVQEVARLNENGIKVDIVYRANCTKSLSSAVVEGFQHATNEIIVVMDGDLQHEPESVPDLVEAIDNADFVVGSRFKGGEISFSWSCYRRIVSFVANALAWCLVS